MVGAILIALAALLVSPLAALLWLAFSAVHQQAENHRIAPVDYRRDPGQPAGHDRGVLVGTALLGLLGALLAIPAAAALQLVVEDLRRSSSYARSMGEPRASSSPAPAIARR